MSHIYINSKIIHKQTVYIEYTVFKPLIVLFNIII